MINITFDSLPIAVAELLEKVSNIEKQISEGNLTNNAKNQDTWFAIEQLCNYLPGNPAKATIYAKVHRREIPHQKSGKRLSFLKSDIDSWLKSQSRFKDENKTIDGASFLKNKKGQNQ